MIHNEENGKIAHNLHTFITENEIKRRNLLAKNAELITEMIDTGAYKLVLGDEKAPVTAYLAQLEVYYSRSEVSRFRAIVKTFKALGVGLDVFDIPDSRLTDIAKFATKENIEEFLMNARTFTSTDWNSYVRLQKGLPVEEDCVEHDFETIHVCKKCTKKTK